MKNKQNANSSMKFIQLFIQLIFIEYYMLGTAATPECFKYMLPCLNSV